MVGIYFKTNHMPVRLLLYIAITALTRHIVDMMSHVAININEMLAVDATTLAIAVAIFIIRYTSIKFSSNSQNDIS